MPGFLSGLAYASLVFLNYKLAKSAYRCYPYFLKSSPLPVNRYVVISGCTDGIGLSFARILHQRNVPLILIGRSHQKLSKLQSELNTNHSNPHKIIQIDFSDQGKDKQAILQSKLSELGVEIEGFVNCVGVSCLGKFQELQQHDVQTVKRVNISPVETVLPTLVRLSSAGNSCFFINISSATAQFPLKYSSPYSASKAYVSNLLTAFSEQHPEVKVLTVEPWFVKTKMVAYKQDWTTVNPSQVVQGALKNLGRRDKCSGCVKHELISQFELLAAPTIIKRVEETYARWKQLAELRKKRNK